mmetsp:Transcript_86434/g.241852  ORF Transcript_86434/g.241852 Transcript_86434/m.241852 type:complete len:414 (-) Transcript_86434:55-1296(-)
MEPCSDKDGVVAIVGAGVDTEADAHSTRGDCGNDATAKTAPWGTWHFGGSALTCGGNTRGLTAGQPLSTSGTATVGVADNNVYAVCKSWRRHGICALLRGDTQWLSAAASSSLAMGGGEGGGSWCPTSSSAPNKEYQGSCPIAPAVRNKSGGEAGGVGGGRGCADGLSTRGEPGCGVRNGGGGGDSGCVLLLRVLRSPPRCSADSCRAASFAAFMWQRLRKRFGGSGGSSKQRLSASIRSFRASASALILASVYSVGPKVHSAMSSNTSRRCCQAARCCLQSSLRFKKSFSRKRCAANPSGVRPAECGRRKKRRRCARRRSEVSFCFFLASCSSSCSFSSCLVRSRSDRLNASSYNSWKMQGAAASSLTSRSIDCVEHVVTAMAPAAGPANDVLDWHSSPTREPALKAMPRST